LIFSLRGHQARRPSSAVTLGTRKIDITNAEIAILFGLRTESGDHQDVVVGADGNHEQAQHDRQREVTPA
jgi:hypothetical protein